MLSLSLIKRGERFVVDLFSFFFSLGVALSRGHGKFFFRGNVTVEEGKKFSLYSLCFSDFPSI